MPRILSFILSAITAGRIAGARCLAGATRTLRQNPQGHNSAGVLVIFVAMNWLYWHAQPTTAGSDPRSANADEQLTDAAKLVGDDTAPEITKNDSAAPSADQSATPVSDTPKLTGKEALIEIDRLLADAEARLEKLPAYAATFLKQERIGDSMTELQVIRMRLVHQPLRVFMKWEGGKDDGQRVLYSTGENNGDMLVRKLKGFESRLGVIPLNPYGSLALKHSRYPVTNVGLLPLVRITRQHRQKDLAATAGVTAKLFERQKFDDRECLALTIEYANPQAAPDDKHEYRKSVVLIDAKTKLPACVRCYGWPEHIRDADPGKLDQTTLLEFYAYKNLDFEAQVQADDFKRSKLQ